MINYKACFKSAAEVYQSTLPSQAFFLTSSVLRAISKTVYCISVLALIKKLRVHKNEITMMPNSISKYETARGAKAPRAK